MPGTTQCSPIQYPVDGDPINVAVDMQKMAEDTAAAICGLSVSALPVGAIIPWWDTGGALPEGKLRCDGSPFDAATYPALEAHMGGTNTPDLVGRFMRAPDATFPAGAQGGSNTPSLPVHNHTSPSHNHTINHDHPSATTSSNGSHSHTINHTHGSGSTNTKGAHQHRWRGQANGNDGGGLGTAVIADWSISAHPVWGDQVGESNGNHTHTVTTPAYNGSSGTTGSHNHTLNVPNYSGNSGGKAVTTNNAGSNSSYGNLPPFTVVEFLIQAV